MTQSAHLQLAIDQSEQQHQKRQFQSFRRAQSAWGQLQARWYPGVRLSRCTLMRCAGMIPVVIVLAIIVVAYVTAVFATLLPLSERYPVACTVLLVVFHLVYFNTLANYLILVFMDPGSVPSDWKAVAPSSFSTADAGLAPSSTDTPDFKYRHMMRETTYQGFPRYCTKCSAYKPDRSHHCSVCQKCILKMDHHCVFVNNCVSFYNHKFFMGFVIYAFLGCFIISIISLPTFLHIITNIPLASAKPSASLPTSSSSPSFFYRSINSFSTVSSISLPLKTTLMIGYIITSAFSFALAMFTILHLYLISKGRTTIEMYEMTDPVRAPNVAQYDLGMRQNFKNVCGNVFLCWFFPTRAYIQGDGIRFERKSDLHQEHQQFLPTTVV